MRARQMGSVVSVFDIDTGIAVIGKPLKKKKLNREKCVALWALPPLPPPAVNSLNFLRETSAGLQFC